MNPKGDIVLISHRSEVIECPSGEFNFPSLGPNSTVSRSWIIDLDFNPLSTQPEVPNEAHLSPKPLNPQSNQK